MKNLIYVKQQLSLFDQRNDCNPRMDTKDYVTKPGPSTKTAHKIGETNNYHLTTTQSGQQSQPRGGGGA